MPVLSKISVFLLCCLAMSRCGQPSHRACDGVLCPTGQQCDAATNRCETIGTNALPVVSGEYLKAGLDHDGRLLVAFYDPTVSALGLLEQRPNQSWSVSYVDGRALARQSAVVRDVGWYPALASDTQGRIHVAYYDATAGNLCYARRDASGWLRETVAGQQSDVGLFNALDVDAADNPHIAFYDATQARLMYAWRTSAGWNVDPLPPQVLDAASGPQGAVGLDYGTYASMRLQPNGPVISFYEAQGGDLFLATRQAGTWRAVLVDGRDADSGLDTGDAGRWSSLAMDGRGRLALAYFEATTGTLRYVAWPDGAPVIETVDDGTDILSDPPHIVGQYATLAMDMNDIPTLVYQDATDMNLRMARRLENGLWHHRVIAQNRGLWPCLAIPSKGSAMVAYATVDLRKPPGFQLALIELPQDFWP